MVGPECSSVGECSPSMPEVAAQNWAWWCTPVNSALKAREVEAGGSELGLCIELRNYLMADSFCWLDPTNFLLTSEGAVVYSVDTAFAIEFGSFPGWPFTAPHSLGLLDRGSY